MSKSNILTDHVALPLKSDTFDGFMDHDMTVGPYDCYFCIAQRAVFRALEGK